jgi:hypothetical protein
MLNPDEYCRNKFGEAVYIFRRVAPAAKPIIRESVLEKSLAENSDEEEEEEGSSEDFHGFSESEIDSAKSRASSLYSEDFLGKLKEKNVTIILACTRF